METKIVPNKCCDPKSSYSLAKELLSHGVFVVVSVGGDGCQGGPPSHLTSLTEEQIVEGFEYLVSSSGVKFSGIDFDWEKSFDNQAPVAINLIGKALRPKGYFVTAVPMSTQFMPGGMKGWTELNPDLVDAVIIQWYEGECVDSETCPCWGSHHIQLSNCPGFSKYGQQQSQKCGTGQWIQGFLKVGKYSWAPNKIVVGAKSSCGNDAPKACSKIDTGIWGIDQMKNIIQNTGVRGVGIWDMEDYFDKRQFNVGSPINFECDWAKSIAFYLNIIPQQSYINKQNATFCFNYQGPMPSVCNNQLLN